jgi:alkylation response protein AidB-like acyl-CoA dehydrogenase
MATTSASERQKQIQEAEELLGKDPKHSFAKELFFGRFDAALAFPYPQVRADESDTLPPFLDRVRSFFQTEVDSDRIDRDAMVPGPLMEQMFDLGIMTMSIPRQYGGLGLSQVAYCKVMEEIGAADASIGVLVNAHQSIGIKSLLLFGTAAQQAEWLPRLTQGKLLAAFALTEPNAGSDAGSVETRAVLNEAGTHYLLNGRKQWITNGGYAGLLTVMAKVPGTQDEKGRERITAFLVTPDMQGFEVVDPRMEKCGIRGTATAKLAFHDLAVPVENIIGPPGKGLRVALTLLDFGRTTFGATCTGVAKRCVADALAYSRTRKQFGKSLCEFELVKQKLARMAAWSYAMESATCLTAGFIDRGLEDYMVETAILKVFASEALWEIIFDTMQIFGGRSYFKDQPYERMMRDARLNHIGEGANDVLRNFIALVGMRDVGLALKEVADAVKTPLSGLGKLTDFARRHLPGQDAVHVSVRSREIADLAHLLEDLVQAFGRAVEWMLIRHREGILDRQYLHARVANAAIDLYHIAAVVSRLDTLMQGKTVGDPAVRKELGVGRYFCKLAERSFRQHLRDLSENLDDETTTAANLLLG